MLKLILRIFLGSFLISPILLITAIDQLMQIYLEKGLLVLIIVLMVCELFVSLAIFLMITGFTFIAFGTIEPLLYRKCREQEITELLEDFRETIDEDIYNDATDFEIIKSFIQCAIIKAKEKNES